MSCLNSFSSAGVSSAPASSWNGMSISTTVPPSRLIAALAWLSTASVSGLPSAPVPSIHSPIRLPRRPFGLRPLSRSTLRKSVPKRPPEAWVRLRMFLVMSWPLNGSAKCEP